MSDTVKIIVLIISSSSLIANVLFYIKQIKPISDKVERHNDLINELVTDNKLKDQSITKLTEKIDEFIKIVPELIANGIASYEGQKTKEENNRLRDQIKELQNRKS